MRKTMQRGMQIAATVLALIGGSTAQVSGPFEGVKADKGTVTFAMEEGRRMLTLSEDFVIPDTPAPHWRLVDASGKTFLMQRLAVKDDKKNLAIEVPAYVPEVATVEIWCAFAETLLGAAKFTSPVGVTCLGTPHQSNQFMGVKANRGTVTHLRTGSQSVLTLSDDFVIPDTPAPHWQVVDSEGNTYLLERLQVKDGVFHKSIVVPDYVADVAKVQIWCAFAETLLGEADFANPVM